MSTKICVVAGAGEVRAPHSWLAAGAKRWQWQGIARAVGAAFGKGGGWVVAARDQPRLSGRNEQIAMRKVAAGELRRSDLLWISTETERLHADRYRYREECTLPGVPLLRFLLLSLLVPVVCGCGKNPGEVPELNPDAHEMLTMDIYIHGGDVDGVEVSSAWEMETRGCAKVNFPAGNLNIGHASPDEEVKKVGDHYESRILLDRFAQVPCRWVLGGVGLNFMRGKVIDSDYVADVNDLIRGRGQKITCFQRRGGFVGFCNLPSRLNDDQKEMTGKYTVNLETRSCL